jgi:hypothetical protein
LVATGSADSGVAVLPGLYTVALVIDGKTVDTKPMRVDSDKEVVLTELERKKMYDMAMEMHDLQKRGTDVWNAVQALTREATEIAEALASRSDVPSDVKGSFESFNKELAALAPKFAAPAGGGRGGGRGGAPADNPPARVAQAKNALMGSMPVAEAVTRAYTDAKAQMPKAVTDANLLFAKATALSASLAKYDLKLTPPAQIAVPATKKGS